jgi:hypothetical protein
VSSGEERSSKIVSSARPFVVLAFVPRKPGEYLSGFSWLPGAPFFALPPEQNDHKRWNNAEDQEAPHRFVIGDGVAQHNGEPHCVRRQRGPENSAPLFPLHDDPNIAQRIGGVERVSFRSTARNWKGKPHAPNLGNVMPDARRSWRYPSSIPRQEPLVRIPSRRSMTRRSILSWST